MRLALVALFIATALAGMAYGADTYTLTTYYPAPNGRYDNLETNTLTCNSDTSFQGNVNIGTTSNGTLTAQNLIVNSRSTLLGDAFINHSSADPFIQFQRASGAAFWLGYDTGSSAFDMRSSSAATDQVFTVTRTGKVGIGAAGSWVPTATLEVQGDAHVTQAVTLDGVTNINNTTTITGATSLVDNDLTLTRTAAGSNSQVIFNNSGSASAIGNGSGALRLSGSTNSISNANVIISGSGLGINTAPGAYALNVSGTGIISGDTNFSSGVVVNNNIITSNGSITIRTVNLSQGAATSGGVPINTLLSSNMIASPGYLHTSDARLKDNITPITDALAKVKALQGVSFSYKNIPGRKVGLIAQNVEKIVPEVVVTDSTGMKSVEYDSLVGLLIEAIKEQQLEIEQLQQTVREQGKRPATK